MLRNNRHIISRCIRSERGFSLLEMILAMSLFMIIMLITSNAFNRMVVASGSIMKSAESNIEGVVGLEMLRKDISQAGYGLAWTVQADYLEAAAMPITTPVFDSYTGLNDTPRRSPRAITSINNAGYNGSDYLAIKSTVAAMNGATKKSAIIRQTGISHSDPAAPFKGTDTVSVVRPVFNSSGIVTNKILIGKGTFANVSSATSTFRPDNANDTFIVYGLDDSLMRTPFNRADYFIYRPTSAAAVPDTCAKIDDTGIQENTGIGILYKAVMKQDNGSYFTYPLLDCVLDMQVVYGVDESTSRDGTINNHYGALPVSTDPLVPSYENASTIRLNLKEVRVYILAQDGKKDRSYTYPNSTVYVGEFNSGRLFDFTTANIKEWQNYRWKIYTIVVKLSL